MKNKAITLLCVVAGASAVAGLAVAVKKAFARIDRRVKSQAFYDALEAFFDSDGERLWENCELCDKKDSCSCFSEKSCQLAEEQKEMREAVASTEEPEVALEDCPYFRDKATAARDAVFYT